MSKINNVSGNLNGFLRYKTSILRCTPKKLKAIVRNLNGLNISSVVDCLAVSPKRVCSFLYKDFLCIKNNLINVYGISNDIIKDMLIGFMVIEKRRKQLGTRFKARGRGNRSCTYNCSLSVYLKHKDIIDFNDFFNNVNKNIKCEINN